MFGETELNLAKACIPPPLMGNVLAQPWCIPNPKKYICKYKTSLYLEKTTFIHEKPKSDLVFDKLTFGNSEFVKH
jgi:hypothetical protein